MTHVSSLYLHVPFCQHLCNYCDFYKRKLDSAHNQFEDFHQFLKESVIVHHDFLNSYNFTLAPLDTIYLGGGTPSLWGQRGAEFFGKEILSLPPTKDAEFTMEIDPGTWTHEMILAWKEIGLNRISVGTQSLDPQFLKVLDRIHSLEDTLNFLTYLKENNWNYSLDFLLGVPFSQERKRDIRSELETLLQYSPKHISLYILNARSKYPHIQEMPDDGYVRDEYLFVSEFLKSKGFHHYEVSNFALPGFESKHNSKYWRGESVAALGPTGTGYLSLSSSEAVRYKWKVTHPEFEVEKLTEKELSLEKLYLCLRTSDGLILGDDFSCVVDSWVQQKYASVSAGRVTLTALGFLMLDSLMDDIFRFEHHVKSR